MFAIAIILGIVVSRIKQGDPNFEMDARTAFDTFLGRLAAEGKAPVEYGAAAREMFMQIIEAPTAQLVDRPQAPGRLTLRRRFQNWLLRD
jgi:hypothetical protein